MIAGDTFSLKLSITCMAAYEKEIVLYRSGDQLIALGPDWGFMHERFVILAQYKEKVVIVICSKELINDV